MMKIKQMIQQSSGNGDKWLICLTGVQRRRRDIALTDHHDCVHLPGWNQLRASRAHCPNGIGCRIQRWHWHSLAEFQCPKFLFCSRSFDDQFPVPVKKLLSDTFASLFESRTQPVEIKSESPFSSDISFFVFLISARGHPSVKKL